MYFYQYNGIHLFQDKHVLSILVPKHKLEIIPASMWQSTMLRLVVDDTEISLQDDEEMELKESRVGKYLITKFIYAC